MSTEASSLPTQVPTPSPVQVPTSLADLGVPLDFISGLILRHLAAAGVISGAELERRMGVPYEVFQPVIDELVRTHLLEQSGYSNQPALEGRPLPLRMNHAISQAGRERVQEMAQVQTRYTGPCPISLEAYVRLVLGQEETQPTVTPEMVAEAFADLELEPRILEEIGSAMSSRSSVFLYGPPGNGKSTIARGMARLLGGPIDVPYAVCVGEEVIRIQDPIYHRPIVNDDSPDRRLMRVARPVVRAGGELRFSQLELTFDATSRIYEAPLQMKASGGVLVIDDFGRQLELPAQLLNRFIVPMEEAIDFLDLTATGQKVEVPFTCQIVFSTNLSPAQLVDEAFLRRIAYKVLVSDPTPEMYSRILQHECERAGVPLPQQAIPFLVSLYHGRPLRGSHPKQLVARIVDRARHRGERPEVTRASLLQAFDAYLNPAFAKEASRAAGGAPIPTSAPPRRPPPIFSTPAAAPAVEAEPPEGDQPPEASAGS